MIPEKSTPPEFETFIGMELSKATELARSQGYWVRLTEVDGEPYSIALKPTAEKCLTFKVVKDLVVEVGD